MKAKLFLAVLLFFSIVSTAQIQDLARLADGKLVFQSTLRDGDNKLYGYFFLYEKNIGTDSITMEYVMLDKNLNKALRGTFNEPKMKFKIKRTYYDCSMMGRKLVLDRTYNQKKTFGLDELILNTFQFIDLDNNTVSLEYKCVDAQFQALTGDFKKEIRKNKSITGKTIINLFTGDSVSGFIVNIQDKNQQNYLEKDLHFFDEDRNYKWTYTYNPNAAKNDYNSYRILYSCGNTLYVALNQIKDYMYSAYDIVAIDINSGKERYKYNFDSKTKPYQRNFYIREIDGQLNLIGSYTNRMKINTGYDFTKSLGFYRIRLDSAGNELESKEFDWADYSKHLKLDEYGFDTVGFKLMPRQYFVFKDNKISILTEKFKPYNQGTLVPIPFVGNIVQLATQKAQQIDDFVLFNFDSDMNLVRVDTIAKEICKNRSTDFSFAEYIQDREGIVFFHVNFFEVDKVKQVVLGINTLINGTLSQEKIPLFSKKEYSIYPMPAKEGYVMLREVNEKEKLNQIRLEKLNYDAL